MWKKIGKRIGSVIFEERAKRCYFNNFRRQLKKSIFLKILQFCLDQDAIKYISHVNYFLDKGSCLDSIDGGYWQYYTFADA